MQQIDYGIGRVAGITQFVRKTGSGFDKSARDRPSATTGNPEQQTVAANQMTIDLATDGTNSWKYCYKILQKTFVNPLKAMTIKRLPDLHHL